MEDNSYEKLISKRSNGNAVLTAVIFVVIVGVVFISESFFAHQSALEKNRSSLLSISKLIEEKIVQNMQAIDLVLQANQRELSGEAINFQNSIKLSRKIKYDIDRINNVYSLKVIDVNGDLVADTLTPIKKINYSDREYFKRLKSSKKNELVINPPIISRTTNVWVIVFGRPIFNLKNEFSGIIIATINVTDFMQNFSKYELSKYGMIALYDVNNVMYLRYPWIDSIAGKKVNRPNLIKQFINSSNIISYDELHSPVDHVTRLTINKKILSEKFIITIGESKEIVLKPWYQKFLFFSFLLISSGIVFYIFFLKFLNSTEELERKRNDSIQAAKLASIGEMTAGIAHEINNPIMIIYAAIRSLRKSLNSDPIKVDQNIQKIEKQIVRIDRIIKGLKSFTRDSRFEDFSFVDISSVLQNSMDLIKSEIVPNNIYLEINDELKNKILECNEIQIEQVFVNIIKNSIDAVKNTPNPWIKIQLLNKNGMIVIRITDSGTGIPEYIRSKIMNPFFTTKEVGKGTGLGLSISQGIIASHGGKFYLDEAENNTCFVIELVEGINFDYVIKSHIEFKDNLKNYIMNPNKSLDKEVLKSDTHCEFGKWIKKYDDRYTKNEDWNVTKAKHKEFHILCAEIVELSESKNLNLLNTRMLQLEQLSDEIIILIFNLKEKLK